MATGLGRAAGIRVAGFVCALVLAAFTCLHAASAPSGTVITNIATVRYTDANGNPGHPAHGSVTTVLEAAPVLKAVKRPSSDPVAMGARLSYTIDYENSGNAPTAGITLVDTLSPLVTPVSYAPAVLQPAAGGQPARLTWSIPALAAGEKGSVGFSVDVSADPAVIRNGDQIVNLLDISSPQTGSQTSLVTTVGQAPNLQVELSASSAQAGPGDNVVYTISYTNIGNLPSKGSLLSIRLPAETALVESSITGNGGIQNRLITWDLGTLPPGAAGTVSFTIRISPLAREGTLIRALAAISCAELGAQSSPEVTIEVRFLRALTLNKTASAGSIRVGDMLGYTLELRNSGNTPLANVVLQDLLPAGTRLVSTTGQVMGETVVWQFPTLAPGEARQGTIELLVGSAAVPLGPVVNVGEAWNIDTPIASSSARTPILSSNRSVIEFITPDGRPVTTFDLDTPIGIRVTDLSENHDPRRVETVQVTLINRDTKDVETLTLFETGPNTGVFEGAIQQTRTLPATPGDGYLSTSEDNSLAVYYNDPEFPGETSLIDLAWVNPVGVVFDSLSGLPVKDAKITIYDNTTGQPANFSSRSDGPSSSRNAVRPNFTLTGADGKFTFGVIPPGSYHLLVESPQYFFPSNAATSTLDQQYLIENGSRGENFTITAEPSPIVFDIPLDREAKDLLLDKTSSKTRASVGEFVPFTVTLTNRSPGPLTGLQVIDTLPHGMQYVPGSAHLDGKALADPVLQVARTLVWTLPTLVTQTKTVLTYVTIIGPGARPGTLANLARAEGLHIGRPVSSRSVSATIEVRDGLFTDRGTVLGKVFLDRDGNGRQNASGEVGIPGIGLYLEDGTHVTTDEEGQYSVPGVLPGAHLMRLDPTMLPADAEPVPVTNRDRDDPRTRLIDLPHGGLFKADFPLRPGPDFVFPVASPAASLPATDTRPVSRVSVPSSWETTVGSMTPGFEILAPADGYQNAGRLLKLVVKSPPGDLLRISVDGHPLEGLKPGKTVSRRDAGVRVQEFYGVPLITEATCTVAVERVDAAGAVLERRSVSVYAAGAGVELRLTPPPGGIRADGTSVGVIRVELLDRHGRLVNVPLSVTIEAGKGDFVTRDADPALEGFQMLLEGGRGEIAIRAPRDTGTSELVVRGGGMIGKAALEFVPDLHPMVALGLGELVIGKGSARGDTSPLRRWEGFEDGTYTGGRGAFFLRGKVGDDVLVTAAYDSAKTRDRELFRLSEADPNLEYRYPIMGDAGRISYAAMSQDKLYLKAERGLSHLLYGDFETGLDETRLGAYNRMFNGAQLVVRGRRAGLRSFLTRTDRTLVVDTLPGQGISGFYALTNRSIVPGSERVVIETRDRWRPEFVLDRQARERDLDYDIDYIMGTIRFKGPVPSSDASLNPVFVVVTYEHESQTRNYEIAGGRGTFRPFKDLELGVTNVLERQLAGDFRLEALDVALRLPGKTLVKAEWAKTTSLIDEMGTLDRRSDKARSIEVTSHPTGRLDLGAWYRRAGDAFRNPSAVDVFSGSHRSGGDLSYRLAQDLVFKSQYYLENDDRNEMFYRHTSAGLEKAFRRTRVGLEYIRERADDGYLPPARQGNRQPFDIAEQTPDDLTAARLTAEHTLNDRMTLELSHKGNLGGRRYRFGQVGMRYQLTPLTRFYVRDEFARFDALTDERLVMGAESEVARDTVAFSEYRLGHGASEARVQQSLGLRNTFMLGKAATGNVTFERLETTEGKELSQQPDATAVSIGVEYLPQSDLKLTTRLERRLSGTGDTDSIDVGTAWRLHRDLHLLFSDRWYRMTAPAAGRDTASRVVLGLAFRPVAWDRFNALAKLERRDGMTSEMQLGDDSRVILYSFDGVYRLSPRWQLAGRFARKTDQELGFTENTSLSSGRVIFDLGRRFDIGAEYRLMKGDTAATTVRGGTVELGARIGKGIWLGLGYSFEKFDADLLGDQYEGKGPFIRIRFRMAEDFLDRKPRRKSPSAPARGTAP